MIPTPEEINALPLHIRAWIHELEATADPAGDRRELVMLREQNQQLQALISGQEAKDDIERLLTPKSHFEFMAEQMHGNRWMALGRNADGDEVWADGACMDNQHLVERIALNMKAAYNKGLEVAVRSLIQSGIKLLDGPGGGRGKISNTSTAGGWVVRRE